MYQKAIELDPQSDAAHNLLGGLFCGQGRLAEGEARFRRALQINASNIEALNNLGNVRKELGDSGEAEEFYRRALELQPEFAVGWNNLGLLYIGTDRPDDAAWCFRRAISADSGNADAHNNLGTALRTQGLVAQAEDEFRAAVEANPSLAEGWCGLGDVLQARGLLDEAEGCCKRALELRPSYPDATNNLATIARGRGDLDGAQAYCDEALRIQSTHIGALNNLGAIASRRSDYRSAEAAYRKSLGVDPMRAVTRFNLSTTLLMLGNYEEGFAYYEGRFDASLRPYARSSTLHEKLRARPRWQGEALGDQHLLVWAEQGLGDSLMMSRYFPELRARGVNSVTVLCDPGLARIVRSLPGVGQVVTEEEEAEAVDFEVHIPSMSLPWGFGTRLASIPATVPYVVVPEGMASAWRGRLDGSGLKVGLVWAGSRALQDDARRSIALERFAPLFSVGGVDFVSLQKGDAAEEWREAYGSGDRYIRQCDDFLDTAALIMNLDLVISVDTAVAHLAGALGRPVWLLNRFESEWRWGESGHASRWYPTMTIFREPYPTGWAAVIEQVAIELQKSRDTDGVSARTLQPDVGLA